MFAREVTGEARVLDITGKVLWKGEIMNNGIDVGFLSPGLYILKCEAGVTEFIKE